MVRIFHALTAVMAVGAASAQAATQHTDVSSFQMAAGAGLVVEDFEGFAPLTAITALPGLEISFGPLNNGSQPSIYGFCCGGDPASGSRSLMNNDKNGVPGLGPITMTVDPGRQITAIGFFDGGSFEPLTLTVFDASMMQLATGQSTSTASASFVGFSGLVGATTVVVGDAPGSGANGWWGFDDLQVATAAAPSAIPLPASGLLLVGALAGAAALRRRRG